MDKLRDTTLTSPAYTGGRPAQIPYYVRALALALPAIMLGIQLSGWIGFLPAIRDGHADFRNLYVAGYMVRVGSGYQLYDYAAQKHFQDILVSHEAVAIPFIRPAYQALLFVPFSLLSYRHAYVAYLLFNLMVLVLCFRLLRPYTNNLSSVWPYLPAAMFLFVPIGAALMQGQDSIILLVLLAAALAWARRGHEYLAGTAVALGLFKFQLVIPIAVLFFAWRRWRFSVAFAFSALSLAAVSVWIAGVEQSVGYARSIVRISTSSGLSSGIPLSVDHMANLHGLLSGICGAQSVALYATVVLSAITMIYAASLRPQPADTFLIAIPVSALVSYYLFIHDMSVLIIPIVLLLNEAIGRENIQSRRARAQIILAALLFVSPAAMSFIPNQFWLVCVPLAGFTLEVSLRRSSIEALNT